MTMVKKSNFVALVVLSTVMAAFAAPGTVRAAGEDKLEQCLEKAKSATEPNQARSQCLWQHYSYMSSYGR